MQTNSILTRGLGGPLLVTQGLGAAFVIEIVGRPRQLRHRGRSGRRGSADERIRFVIVDARMVSINGVSVPDPKSGRARIDFRMLESVRVRGVLAETKRRSSPIVITARRISDVDF